MQPQQVAPSIAAYRAVVVGGTGAVGTALVRQLLASSLCTGVVILVRRPVDLFAYEADVAKLTTHVIDLSDLERAAADKAQGCQVAFCTMGVGQPRKISHQEFRKVDVQYAGDFATGCRAAGVRHMSLLSSVGADSSSRSKYLVAKGDAEAAVSAPGFERVSLFRPSLLVTKETRYGLQDVLTQGIFPVVSWVLPQRLHQIRVEELARVMRINAERPAPPPPIEVLQYPEFVALGDLEAPPRPNPVSTKRP